MPRLVKIGELGVGRIGQIAEAIVGRLANPCLDYVEYMEEHHPGELSAKDAAEWRLTYGKEGQRNRDPEVEMECLAMLQQRIRRDRK